MHTVVLNVENETIMNKLKEFVAGLKEGISIEKDIELLDPNDPDYHAEREAQNGFDPKAFYGASHTSKDEIDQELATMRDEWNTSS